MALILPIVLLGLPLVIFLAGYFVCCLKKKTKLLLPSTSPSLAPTPSFGSSSSFHTPPPFPRSATQNQIDKVFNLIPMSKKMNF